MVRNAKKKISDKRIQLFPISYMSLLAFFLCQVMSQFSEQHNSDKKNRRAN